MDIMMTNGDGGPFMSGTWYNPNTGDSFTVRDTFFEDNNLIVMTTDGRRLNYDIVSRYIKSDKPIPKQPQQPMQQQPMQQQNELPKDLQEMISEDPGLKIGVISDPIQQYPLSVATTGIYENTKGVVHEEEDEDMMLIRRIMKRVSMPDIDCDIKWDKFPEKQFEMLEMMCIDEDKIAEFVMNSFDLKTIQEQIKKSIIEYIKNPKHTDTVVEIPAKTNERSNITVTANTTTAKDPISVLNTTTKTNKKKTTKKK